MALLKLKVSPKASRNTVQGWHGEELKIAVTAAPDKGKANAAVIKLLARALQCPTGSIQIKTGHTNPQKTLVIDNLDDHGLRSRLDELLK